MTNNVPTYVDSDGTEYYYKNDLIEYDKTGRLIKGIRHRPDDKPAVYNPTTGYSEYIINGKFHRDDEDEPSVINPVTGHKAWYKHGKKRKRLELLYKTSAYADFINKLGHRPRFI